MAPEILKGEDGTYASDLWSLGIMLYQFLVGQTPFKGSNQCETFKNILCQNELEFPSHIQQNVRDLIEKLLMKSPDERIGNEDLALVYEHPFFEGVNFQTLRQSDELFNLLGKSKCSFISSPTTPFRSFGCGGRIRS